MVSCSVDDLLKRSSDKNYHNLLPFNFYSIISAIKTIVIYNVNN